MTSEMEVKHRLLAKWNRAEALLGVERPKTHRRGALKSPVGKPARNERERLERRDDRGQAWGIASSRLSSTRP